MLSLPLSRQFRTFLRAEDGAVTVDFVPLLSVVVGAGLAVSGEI